MGSLEKIITFSHIPMTGALFVEPEKKAYFIAWEVSTILGYIPGVGTIVGIARAIFAAVGSQDLNDKKLQKPFMIRALIEGLSLGIFLLPLDIFNTAVHSSKFIF